MLLLVRSHTNKGIPENRL